jgi:hypothetical protein
MPEEQLVSEEPGSTARSLAYLSGIPQLENSTGKLTSGPEDLLSSIKLSEMDFVALLKPMHFVFPTKS